MAVPNDKPTATPPQFESIPQHLRDLPRWVLWRYVWRTKPNGGGAWTKLPMQAGGKAARSTDPATWTPYADARAAFARKRGGADGVGFVFTGDGLIGIDLDDCIDAMDQWSPMARDLASSVPGYLEVSPSGLGVKLFCHAPGIRRAYANKPLGIEVYATGRYFTVTGHAVTGDGPGAGSLDPTVDDTEAVQAWLGRWAEGAAAEVASDDDADGLGALRAPLDDWALQRFVDEVLGKLDADCGYAEWLQIGMAMHHQFEGSTEALDAWDEWSSASGKYADGVCEEKWDSFDDQHGGGVVTLKSVLEMVKGHSVATSKGRIEQAIEKINAVLVVAEFEGPMARKIRDAKLSDTEREQLAVAIQKRITELNGTRVPIGTVRGWLKKRPEWHAFPDVDADGRPLSTHSNVAEVLGRMGALVRYNVITKEDDIVIDGEAYTLDNKANASLARVTSECAKYEVPLGQVKNYITLLADQNVYNPVLTWIESVPWDGVDRLEALYRTVGVKPGEEAMRELLMRHWLVQCVAILHNTGSLQARGVLTFQGAENKGKSRWVMSLVPEGSGYVRTGLSIDTRNKDSTKIAVSCWIAELGEVDTTFKRSDMGSLKAFIAQSVDTFRKPYAAAEGSYPRRTAMFASVNDEEFLVDTSGNTRFWVLHTTHVDHAHSIDMQQLWAQVLQLWKNGEKHWLNEEEALALVSHNESFTEIDPMEERIRDRFCWPGLGKPVCGGVWMTATAALQLTGMTKPGNRELRAASRVIKELNGDNKKFGTAGEKLLLLPPVKGSAEAEFEDSGSVL